MPLSDARLRSLKAVGRPTKLSDGGGLHVLVMPHGSKLWRLAYRFDGKQKLLALGSYPALSLGDARARRDEAKRLLATGNDPSVEAKREKLARQDAVASTFGRIADEFLAKTEREGKADATVTKKRWLVGLAVADLGRKPIADITAADVLVPLRRVEAQGNYETARRLPTSPQGR